MTTKTAAAVKHPKADLDAMLDTPAEKPSKKTTATTTGNAKKPAKAPKKEVVKVKPEAAAKRAAMKERLKAAKAKPAEEPKAEKKAAKEDKVVAIKAHHIISDDAVREDMALFGISGEVDKDEAGNLVCSMYIGDQFVEVPATKERQMATWLRSLHREIKTRFDAEIVKVGQKLAKRIEDLTDENEKLQKKMEALEKKAKK